MICIAALILFAFLGIFSVTYRKLAKEAWVCVARRVTLRPCETDFQTKVKGLVVGKLIGKSEKLAGFVSHHFRGLAYSIVILSIISTVYLGYSAYNYVRYQTCDPWNGSCPIGSQICKERDAGSFWAGLQRIFGGANAQKSTIAGPELKESVELVEYGDFQCPACSAGALAVEEALQKYGSRVTFTFKHFPLSFHQWATQASWAAEAANRQNKFYDMYLKLYAHQTEWVSSKDAGKLFETYAGDLKLDVEKFKKDYASADVKDKVEKDRQEGMAAGIDATPTFKIDGVTIIFTRITPDLISNEVGKRLK